MKKSILGSFFLLFLIVSSTWSAAYAADPELPTFRQPPAVDTRAVLLEITKDKTAEVQIVVANPALNDGVTLTGEVIFRLPPGMVIYDSTGGSGGSGFHQAGLGDVEPGKNNVMPFYIMSDEVGEMMLFSSITYWPKGNPEDANTTHSTFPIYVEEPSDPSSFPSSDTAQSNENTATVAQAEKPTESLGSTSFTSATDNPLGWSNWSFLLIFGGLFIVVIFVAFLLYKYLKSRSDNQNW